MVSSIKKNLRKTTIFSSILFNIQGPRKKKKKVYYFSVYKVKLILFILSLGGKKKKRKKRRRSKHIKVSLLQFVFRKPKVKLWELKVPRNPKIKASVSQGLLNKCSIHLYLATFSKIVLKTRDWKHLSITDKSFKNCLNFTSIACLFSCLLFLWLNVSGNYML